jgi:GT2 family glycosyltransferase
MNIPSETPLISVVVPSYNGARYLEACLQSLVGQTCDSVEIVVVDNASKDDTAQVVARIAPAAALLRMPRNLGFAGAANAGIREARGKWIALLNNDTEADVDWLSECMAAAARHPEASFLACRILEFQDRGRVYSAGDCFLRAGIGYRRGQDRRDDEEYHKEEEIFSACGCAALYRKSTLEERGGFDERFFAYLEDVELAVRLQSVEQHGWYVPKAVVYHHGGATSGGEFSPLAVRLRTRNSLLLVLKSLPGPVILRSLLPIAVAQLFWIARAVAHGRLWSYLRGLAGAMRMLPGLVGSRRLLRRVGRRPAERLWQAILSSESMARKDVTRQPTQASSLFLKWYFRLF